MSACHEQRAGENCGCARAACSPNLLGISFVFLCIPTYVFLRWLDVFFFFDNYIYIYKYNRSFKEGFAEFASWVTV